MKRTLATLAAAVWLVGAAWAGPAKNVILMIADGAGYNQFQAASYYEHGALGTQVYDSFPVQYGCANYMSGGGYDPAAMWSAFGPHLSGATDSAAAATALYCGQKTYDGAISVDLGGNPITTIAEYASGLGMRTGTVSSVQFAHATPGAVDAHNVSRNHYAEIANEMIYNSDLDVILGCGNPDYTNDGVYSPGTQDYKYVGGPDTWQALQDGTTGRGWTLIQDKADFELYANDPAAAPDRLIGVPKVYQTLQYNRTGDGLGGGFENPSGDRFIPTVPTLETMTEAALNVLAKDDSGFFLMVEGGAVDWAGHGNNMGRLLEEQMDFNASVESVVQWVQANSSWDETLLIVTADHETGALWGPDADPEFTPLVNHGQGALPGYSFHSGSHTNQLVPLFAIGAGSELFGGLVDGTDPGAAAFWGTSGEYVDNTDVFTVMYAAVPEPASLLLVVLGGLVLRRR